ncbi:MAG: helix-turn-helix domain-containing protein [Peptococcaceae bacterium]|nr:helix-turn-helix domain-containing protein [Peptococcaceae bacterium]
MTVQEESTLEKIRAAAMAEFTDKGFMDASLRRIAKEAGVTTGALYGYFKNKEALFAALVGEEYHFILDSYTAAQRAFAELPEESQPELMGTASDDCMREILRYALSPEHLPAMQLLLFGAEGTAFAHLLEEMVDIEVQSTEDYMQVLAHLGRPAPTIDPQLEHMLTTGMINMFFEIIRHELPLAQAEHYYCEMRDFYTAGWLKIMGQ